MRVVVCVDEFGGTLSAPAVAEAVAAGWCAVAPGDTVLTRPLSDGGPGFVAVLAATLTGRLLTVPTTDPLGRPVTGQVLVADRTGYVESAHACGLHLLAPAERAPGTTTSYGLGALVTAAVDAGAGTVVVGLGGSGTNDGGAGLLAALGAVPVDASGTPLGPGGAALARCAALAGGGASAWPRGVELIAATDVDNPLTGEYGASAVFGPQKGAAPADVRLLDRALTRFAGIVRRDLPGCPADLADLPGAGAAGGLGAAILALGGRRESGIGLVHRLTGLDAALDGADLVITGEGSFDDQSLRGKVVAGVAAAARDRGVPCALLAGRVRVAGPALAAAGITVAYSLVDHFGRVETAMARPGDGLRALAARLATEWSR